MPHGLRIPGCENRAANVVVTGGSAGLGRATAVAFAKHGCNVAVIARDPGRLTETRRDIEAAGGHFEDQALVEDGNLVSSRVWPDISEFSRGVLQMLEKTVPAEASN